MDTLEAEFSVTDISCTSCHGEINIYKQSSTFQHPILRVLICKKCFKWYTSGEIEKGEDGTDLQCRWCGDGGDVFCCNNCSNVFCKECITINLGDEELDKVETTDKWCCYVCDGEPLASLRDKYNKLKKTLDSGMRITIIDEDDDHSDETERVQTSANTLPIQWDAKTLELSVIDQENAEKNLQAFEKGVTSLVPISRTLSNSLSYALSQAKKIDPSSERQALHKLNEICNKINSNLQNLLNAFSAVKSSRNSNPRNRKKRERKGASKNGRVAEDCSENGHLIPSTQELSNATKPSEVPRIRLTISKKSLGLTSNADDSPSFELRNEETRNGEIDDNNDNENDNDGEEAIFDNDDEKNEEANESVNEESEKEEEEASVDSSGDEYNPKGDIRDIKEQIKQRKERGSQPKSKAAKRSLQKIKEKLRLKKLKIQLEKSKRGSKDDGEEEEDDDDDDDDDEEEEEEEGDHNENDDEVATGHGDKKVKKKAGLKKNKKMQKGGDDEEEDGDEEHCSKRRKNILDKKLQRFQRSKVQGEEEEEEEDSDADKSEVKGIGDSFDDIDKSIRSIDRLLKQKFAKGKHSNDNDDNDCDDFEKSTENLNASMKDEDDNDDEESARKTLKKAKIDSFNSLDCSSKENSKGGKDTIDFGEVDKKKKSLITKDLFMDDSMGNMGAVDDNDDDAYDFTNDGKEGDTSMREFDVSNEDKHFEEEMEEPINEHGGDDEDENCDDIIEKVIEHCSLKRKKNSNKIKSLIESDDDEEKVQAMFSNDEDDEEDNGVTGNEPCKSDNDDVGMRKSKKKKDRLLAASLLSSDDERISKKQESGDEAREGASRKKKRSKKKKGDDDDDEDDEGLKAILAESDEDGKKKKRRRIRMESSSDDNEKDGDSSDDFQSPSSGKKRKKIHKIFTSKKLSKETIDAAKAEEERKKRIEDRQKLFNQVIVEDSDSPTKCPITTKLVLEIDPETQEPLIEVHKKVICKLKPHQVEAVKFMWSCCIESLEMLKKEEGSGCILAHCMGLGKTLSVISFVHTVLRFRKLTNLKTCLVLTPLNTILNWDSEFERWLKGAQPLDVYELSTVKDNWSRSEVIKNWREGGGVLIMGYDMFRTLSQLTRVKNKKQKVIITEGLLDPGADLVVCDEGHVLKNDNTGLSKACNKLKTRRRIVLTGTPLQNNLVEYHCMVNFVKPNLLGTRKEFLNRFVNPITNGQCSDSTPRDVKIMKNRAHVLHETLNGCVQRRDYSSLTKYLLPKYEYVISIRLSKVQVDLYQAYLQRSASGDTMYGPIRGSRIFTDYQNLMKIWTHPWVLKLDEIRQECKRLYKDDGDSFIDDSNEESFFDSEESALDAGSGSEDDWRPRRKTRNSTENNKTSEPPAKKRKKKAKFSGSMDEEENEDKEDNKEVVKGWKSKSRRGGEESIKEESPLKIEEDEKEEKVSNEWWADYLKMEDEYDTSISGKLVLLAEILKLSESIGDKVLLFSQSLLSLDLIENFLLRWDEDPKKKFSGTQGWYKGVDYIRMDGSTSAQNRKDWTEMFNDETNQKVRLFLISTKAGSLGINLVAANRVIIFDASWNPTHDVQSIFRVYRFGQTKPVYVYRFLAQGTMEEKIYERQVLKQSLAQRVIDEHQIERHFTSADLRELYTFKPDIYDPENKQPTPKLPSDRLLAEILKDHDKWIMQYHEHDSLLENRPEEELTEEERKAAWEEYELEKKGLLFRHNNALPNMMGQQGEMFANNYFAEVQKFIQALYLQNPGITQEQLNEKAKYFMHLQMTQQQNYMQHQQRERERLMRLQQANMMRQRMANLQSMGPITIDEEPSSSTYPPSQTSPQTSSSSAAAAVSRS